MAGRGERAAAKVAAILYSLIETAKLQGRDPHAYLLEAAKAAIRTPGTVHLAPLSSPRPLLANAAGHTGLGRGLAVYCAEERRHGTR